MKNIINKILIIISQILSFIILDIGLRYITYNDYKFYSYLKFTPLGFSLAWTILLISILSFIPKKNRNKIYLLFLIISIIITYSEYIHMKILNTFYGLSDLLLLKEASYYFKYSLSKTDTKITLLILISLLLGIISIILSKK